jgi:hypothetical protein
MLNVKNQNIWSGVKSRSASEQSASKCVMRKTSISTTPVLSGNGIRGGTASNE